MINPLSMSCGHQDDDIDDCMRDTHEPEIEIVVDQSLPETNSIREDIHARVAQENQALVDIMRNKQKRARIAAFVAATSVLFVLGFCVHYVKASFQLGKQPHRIVVIYSA